MSLTMLKKSISKWIIPLDIPMGPMGTNRYEQHWLDSDDPVKLQNLYPKWRYPKMGPSHHPLFLKEFPVQYASSFCGTPMVRNLQVTYVHQIFGASARHPGMPWRTSKAVRKKIRGKSKKCGKLEDILNLGVHIPWNSHIQRTRCHMGFRDFHGRRHRLCFSWVILPFPHHFSILKGWMYHFLRKSIPNKWCS